MSWILIGTSSSEALIGVGVQLLISPPDRGAIQSEDKQVDFQNLWFKDEEAILKPDPHNLKKFKI